MFLVGLLPALVSFAIRRGMGEPDAFTKDIAVTQQVSFTTRLRMLFADRATSKASIGILILLLGTEFWLLRPDDLDAQLSLPPVLVFRSPNQDSGPRSPSWG
ncbi:Uncharacterised protein [Raoultella planticola]|uniref:Uncharacterized protein n=1 Tax=Raoultella planticola TaxID=575 RepID=A0A485CTY8_RAOPL|nr:Uncharacterised protein [Raoultella planticola]